MSARLVTPTAGAARARRRVRRRLPVPRRRAVPPGAARDVRPPVRPRGAGARCRTAMGDLTAPPTTCRPGQRTNRSTSWSRDLDTVCESLTSHGAGDLAVAKVGPVRRAVVTFGVHLCGLDLRQNSRVHEAVVGELLARAEVCADYASLAEAERVAVLERELLTPRLAVDPRRRLQRPDHQRARRAPRGRRCDRSARTAGDPPLRDLDGGVGQRRARGRRAAQGGRAGAPARRRPATLQALRSAVDIVPLFETIDDLAHSAGDAHGDAVAPHVPPARRLAWIASRR